MPMALSLSDLLDLWSRERGRRVSGDSSTLLSGDSRRGSEVLGPNACVGERLLVSSWSYDWFASVNFESSTLSLLGGTGSGLS